MFKRLRYQWTRIESVIGLWATFVLGFAPPVLLLLFGLAALVNEENARDAPAWLCFSGLAATAASGVWTARMASRALALCHPELGPPGSAPVKALLPEGAEERVTLPLAVVMGARLPRVPWLLAAPLGVWWLAHFGSGAFLGRRTTFWLESAVQRPSPLLLAVAPQALTFALTFAANLYLLLALALFVRSVPVLLRLWKFRLALNVAITLAVWVSASLSAFR
jgi:hypothetical protein